MDINHPVSEYFYNPNDPESSETGFFYQPRPDKKSQIQDDIVFNDNDELRKGYNVVLQNGKKVASFGISKWGDVEEDPKDFLKLPEKKSFSNSIFFWEFFLSSLWVYRLVFYCASEILTCSPALVLVIGKALLILGILRFCSK